MHSYFASELSSSDDIRAQTFKYAGDDDDKLCKSESCSCGICGSLCACFCFVRFDSDIGCLWKVSHSEKILENHVSP